MLILTRRVSEAVDLTDTRRDEALGSVILLAVPARNTARLGFEMEKHIQVLRDDALKVRGARTSANGELRYSFEYAPSDGLFIHDKQSDDITRIAPFDSISPLIALLCEQQHELQRLKEKAHAAHA